MHYKVMKAIQDNIESIYRMAVSNGLYICSNANDMINTGVIIVSMIDINGSLLGFADRLKVTGFIVSSWEEIPNGYYRICIKGYIGW